MKSKKKEEIKNMTRRCEERESLDLLFLFAEHFGARLFGLWNPHKDLFKFADLRKRWRDENSAFCLLWGTLVH
ncbi:hypothetical protein LOK49_LG07G00075 [Camellia lanceoleosa]|uniref:Uncharacterized protein n=1 Tax=Camellia lanceoleosa TaxID=1840588 RepID=A0ACC0H7M8_9ERIC|nr:hypothetical protein LOK49_LG07G00075 [Camellia lanceoleosa]